MKVICDRGVLVEALNLVAGVVNIRTPKPVLTCVKLSAKGGVLTMSATDLEAAMRLTIQQVEVREEGEALAPADKFSAIVRESVDPTLTIDTTADATHVRGADSHFKIFGYNVEEFPPIPAFEGDSDFQIPAGHLVELINKTLFATARETSRYAINGVLVEREGKKLHLVATDGRRLALAKGTCSEAAKAGSATAIVPSKALQLLQRVLNDPAEVVKVRVAGNQAHFATDSVTLTTNLVEGNFPPYKDVIPKEQDRKAVFNVDALSSAVRRAALLTNEESKGVKFAFKDGKLTLTSRAPEMGEAEVVVPIESFTGEPIEIGFNPGFVTDVLKVTDSQQITIDLKAPNKPGTLRSGADFLYVVMPVSLS
jgi:DNA polymerase-3 subunit beta